MYRRRFRLAAAAVVIAAFWVIGEPLGKGHLLLALTRTHGIDVGDLPALALLAWAAGLAVVPQRRKT